jgi:hypothetical protein
MNILPTVSESDIVMETPEEKFENDVLNKDPFLPDTAIYYLELMKNSDPNANEEFNSVVEKGKKLQTTADMILDEQMTAEQAWTVFCKTPDGKEFAEKFVSYAKDDKKKHAEKGFENLVVCLDKTNTIINSVLNTNGA